MAFLLRQSTSSLLFRAAKPIPSIGLTQSALLARLLSTKTKSLIQDTIKKNKVCLFMKGTQDAPMCGFSRAAVQILQVQGVEDMKTVNVLEDEEIRSGIKEFSSWPTIPQIYINGNFIGGCDILLNMHKDGSLEELLKKEGIVKEEEETK
ncbi:glutaredoxin [Paraphysoderma sedebokerense]|nr:glutaredoxin [Paraphysoderma sedebokerense]